ncbi:MAG: NAD(P)/FAD-dependent oxidoreductase [Methylococcaceae bacterium]
MLDKNSYDIIIAGAGPAGTTAATLLVQYGYKVLLIEQGQHPRFHIGESMLPMTDPIMQRLGMDWGTGNLKKGGAEFIDEKSGKKVYFPFQGKNRTYQVDRADFDQRLFNNAVLQGVTAHQNEKVSAVNCHIGGVEITTEKTIYQGKYFIDATGRNALMGKQNKSINKLNKLGKYALYKHYKLAETAVTKKLFETGNIEIMMTEIGWIWCIPLTGNRLSVGLVVQKQKLNELKQDQLFDFYIQASSRMTELLFGAESLTDVCVEADFSYVNKQRFGLRYACCGDSSGFLDPVFSSGFFFAIKTAEVVADQVHVGFMEQRLGDAELMLKTDEIYQTGFQTMFLMIERFYCSNIVHNLFFESDREPRLKDEIVELLSGDLWTETNTFQQGLLRGRNKLKFTE